MSRSLESVLEFTKIAIEDSNKIVIDTIKTQSSNKKLRLNQDTKSNKVIQAESWRDKFVRILNDKEDEINDLEKELEITKAREKQLEAYSLLLEEKLKVNEQQITQFNDTSSLPSNTSSITSSSGNSDENSTLTDDISILRDTVKFYEKVTSCAVKRSLESNNKYICTVKNELYRTAIKFELDIGEEIVFTPIANIDYLPDYLHCQISFEPKMAPVMMGDILQALYEEKEN